MNALIQMEYVYPRAQALRPTLVANLPKRSVSTHVKQWPPVKENSVMTSSIRMELNLVPKQAAGGSTVPVPITPITQLIEVSIH